MEKRIRDIEAKRRVRRRDKVVEEGRTKRCSKEGILGNFGLCGGNPVNRQGFR